VLQELAIGVTIPPPFDRILKSICCRQLRKILEDVQK
jgi:hypothetical protein